MHRIVPLLSLVVVLVSLSLTSTAPAAKGGRGSKRGGEIFRSRGCGACHSLKRRGTALTRRAFLAEKGPDLWYAGSKFREGWLGKWLASPRPIRPLAYNSLKKKNTGRHPRLAPGEAAAVASYLMGLKAPDLVRPVGIRPGVNVRGRVVFIKRFACYGCHLVKVRRTIAGGLSGPSLVGARERLNPEWIYAFLTNQRAFEPVGRMPVYAGLTSDSKMKALAAYVAGLE